MEGESTPTTGTTRNAHARYKERIASLGTDEIVRERAKKRAESEETKRAPGRRHYSGGIKDAVAREIEDILETEGLTFLSEEIRNKSAQKEPLPPFPFVIFTLAVIKDVIDTLSLTLVGMLLTKPLTLLIAIVLFLWFLGKMSGRWWKGKMLAWFWLRFWISMGIEAVAEIFPAASVLVLMAYHRETKTVKILNGVLEKLHSSKFKLELT